MDEKSKRNLAIILLALSSPLGLYILFYVFGPIVSSIDYSWIVSIPILAIIFAAVGGFWALNLKAKKFKQKNIALVLLALGAIWLLFSLFAIFMLPYWALPDGPKTIDAGTLLSGNMSDETENIGIAGRIAIMESQNPETDWRVISINLSFLPGLFLLVEGIAGFFYFRQKS